MTTNKNIIGYNERLFKDGFRGSLHRARFVWFKQQINRLRIEPKAILELGCFDGKLIDYLDKKPERYVGFDANWEGGLEIARAKWNSIKDFKFINVTKIDDMSLVPNDCFDTFVCMETLEHLPPGEVEGYLEKISRHLDGYVFVTIPNEKGLFCVIKWLVKKMLGHNCEKYTISELYNTILGRMKYVERIDHKGFCYEATIKMLSKYFDVLEVGGQPFPFLPLPFCFTVTILARSKKVRK
jgi:2-polyprenyl-3-methyl-5-hydroxy-6-metoxy-1,4-benzoquinol methylase